MKNSIQPENRKKDHIRKGNLRLRNVIILLVLIVSIWGLAKFGGASGQIITEVKKISSVISLIQSTYVEDPDLSKLTEGAIEGMLKRLDPHSIYIPPKDQAEVDERDFGEFEGIGISFMIQNELITVIAPITGTPADRLGIRAGDRIVEIEGISAFGITTDEVFQKLRGPKGTAVNVKVMRDGVPGILDFTIVREKIPIRSVWTSFMIDESTGYILLNQFMATTDVELNDAIDRMEATGMSRLIFDLRNNQGGRLSQAVSVADMFIPKGHVLVIRDGRSSKDDSTYKSTAYKTRKMFDLIILVNGGSASASEIVAGAVQDLDRGLIVGENSFGKGLVQVPYGLKDGGVIRISAAHWYTPLGRLVQRSYDNGRAEYYAVRYRDDEQDADSSNRKAFTTPGGRVVYESSGIAPDVEVEERLITGATARLLNERLIFAQAEIISRNAKLSSQDNFMDFRREFVISEADIEGLIALAKEKDIDYPQESLEKDKDYLISQLKAEVAQLVWNSRDYYYQIRVDSDPVVQAAIESFDDAREVASIWH